MKVLSTSDGGGGGTNTPGITLVGPYASRPPAGKVGRRYVCTDGSVVEYVDDGTAWRPLIQGNLGTEVAPGGSLAAYTDRNFQVGTTLAATAGQGLLAIPNVTSGNSIQGFDVPRAAGKSLTASLLAHFTPISSPVTAELCFFGLYFLNTTSGALLTTEFLLDTGTSTAFPFSTTTTLEGLDTWTNFTTVSSSGGAGGGPVGINAPVWMRIRDDGTFTHAEWSVDGKNWLPVASNNSSRTSDAGFNVAGVMGSASNIAINVEALSLQVA